MVAAARGSIPRFGILFAQLRFAQFSCSLFPPTIVYFRPYCTLYPNLDENPIDIIIQNTLFPFASLFVHCSSHSLLLSPPCPYLPSFLQTLRSPFL
ncbi:hypothetical protein K438DRAFT_17991 [Mycena galopus ATCC 62051]|nr:hypothetical protein K438DRAFT_17991 [Mycena galopus ATCC 62051]